VAVELLAIRNMAIADRLLRQHGGQREEIGDLIQGAVVRGRCRALLCDHDPQGGLRYFLPGPEYWRHDAWIGWQAPIGKKGAMTTTRPSEEDRRRRQWSPLDESGLDWKAIVLLRANPFTDEPNHRVGEPSRGPYAIQDAYLRRDDLERLNWWPKLPAETEESSVAPYRSGLGGRHVRAELCERAAHVNCTTGP
jgi:hypothetical protein